MKDWKRKMSKKGQNPLPTPPNKPNVPTQDGVNQTQPNRYVEPPAPSPPPPAKKS